MEALVPGKIPVGLLEIIMAMDDAAKTTRELHGASKIGNTTLREFLKKSMAEENVDCWRASTSTRGRPPMHWFLTAKGKLVLKQLRGEKHEGQ
jgi:predicted ArsR family transcriptional regulator